MSWYTDIKTWIANNIRTNHQREITGAKMNTVLNDIVDEVDGKVDKVSGKGLSTNDYTDTDKAKVASALQTETDPTVPSWAKQSTKPSYDYSEIGNTPDLSGFITKNVNDLANYYLKSETYTKTEVTNLIAAINQFHYEIAASTSAVTNPQSNVLYLIGPVGSGSDKYEEYVYPDSTTGWVKIGDTSIDLSGYVTTSALNTALAAYTTTSDLTTLLSNKADKWIPSTAGNIAKLTAEGNLADGGILASEIVTFNNIASKADMVSNATSGHLAGLDEYGNLTDSGIAASDVATTSDVNGKLSAPATAGTSGQVLTSDGQGGQSWQTPQSGGVTDVTVGGTSVVSGGVAAVPAIPTVPTISTDIASDATSDTKTTSPKAVKTFVENKGYGTYSKPSGGIPASDLASGVIPNSVVNATSQQDGTVVLTKVNGDTITIDLNHVHPQYYSKEAEITHPSGGMLPDVTYKLGTLTGATTFSFAAAVSGNVNHYYFTFTSGSTAVVPTWPASITSWDGNCVDSTTSLPVIAASKTYEVSVLDGNAIIKEW